MGFVRAPHGVFLRRDSAGHSQQIVTGLKSTFLKAPLKSQDATCGAVQADTPLRYVTAFKLSIGERNEKTWGQGSATLRAQGQTLRSAT